MTGIPLTQLTKSESDRLLLLDQNLKEKIVGQDEAIQLVTRAIKRARTGLKDPHKPIGSFLFIGPSAVGKTKLAQELAIHLFDKTDALISGRITPPIYVRVKPTNRCNHRCYYCSYADKDDLNLRKDVSKQDSIPWDRLKKVLNDFGEMGVKATTYSGGGEPLLYPGIADVFQRTKDNGMDLSIITNGQLLMGDKAEQLADAKWVRVSIDYYDAESMAKFRSVKEKLFKGVMDNIENFTKIKSPD